MTTSRISRKPVVIPAGVEVKIQNSTLTAKGPKGHRVMQLHPYVNVIIQDAEIRVSQDINDIGVITGSNVKLSRSIPGTMRAVIHNVIKGVSEGFEKKLILIGVGYRAQAKGKVLSLSLGFSHPTDFAVPEGVTVETPTQTEIVIKGVDKELVGSVASKIRKIRGPEPYKGKGVRYADEKVILKETKKK